MHQFYLLSVHAKVTRYFHFWGAYAPAYAGAYAHRLAFFSFWGAYAPPTSRCAYAPAYAPPTKKNLRCAYAPAYAGAYAGAYAPPLKKQRKTSGKKEGQNTIFIRGCICRCIYTS